MSKTIIDYQKQKGHNYNYNNDIKMHTVVGIMGCARVCILCSYDLKVKTTYIAK